MKNTTSGFAAVIGFVLLYSSVFAAGAPTVMTGSVKTNPDGSLTLQGVVNPNGFDTLVSFEYGPSTSLGFVEPSQSLSRVNKTANVVAHLRDLEPGTTYYYRVFAESDGGTAQGSLRSFTVTGSELALSDAEGQTAGVTQTQCANTNQVVTCTPGTTTQNTQIAANYPAMGGTTLAANSTANTGAYSATLYGFADPNGIVSKVWFEIGKTQALGTEVGGQTIQGYGSRRVSFQVNGLDPNTTYFYRAVMQNGGNLVMGDIVSFRTRSIVTGTTAPKPTSTTGTTSTVDLNANPLITVNSTVDQTDVEPGDELTFKVIYKNVATTDVRNISLKVILPEQVEFLSANKEAASRQNNNLTFNLGTLKSKAEGSITIKAKVKDDAEPGSQIIFTSIAEYNDQANRKGTVSSQLAVKTREIGESSSTSFLASLGNSLTKIPDYVWFIIIVIILTASYFAYQYVRGREEEIALEDEPEEKRITITTTP